MEEYEVTSRNEFIAALIAASQPNKHAASAHPFRITLIGTRYTFTASEGMHEYRAYKIAKRLRRMPQRLWEASHA